MPSLQDQIATLLLTTNANHLDCIANGPDSGYHADRLAGRILDLLARHAHRNPHFWLSDLRPVGGHTDPRPQSPTPPPTIIDALPLPSDLSPDLNRQLATLCAASDLTFRDIAFRENQPVIVATDAKGIREYYTYAALQQAQGEAELSTSAPPITDRRKEGNP